jgi:electron transport complex protein RnfG
MSADTAPAAPAISSRRMIATLGATALICGVLVVTAYQITLPRIQENQRQMLEHAVFQVLPDAVTRRTFVLTPEGLQPSADVTPDGVAIHAGYDTSGKLVGVAAEGAAHGYQDIVRLLYGYSPECECITGIYVLRNNDTPGLGDRIASDPEFLQNFKALSARLNADKTGLAHAIVTVKHGKKVEPWQIDAISGASVTSRAVGKALNDSAQTVVPKVAAQYKILQQVPKER